jgi:hypothetical protein
VEGLSFGLGHLGWYPVRGSDMILFLMLFTTKMKFCQSSVRCLLCVCVCVWIGRFRSLLFLLCVKAECVNFSLPFQLPCHAMVLAHSSNSCHGNTWWIRHTERALETLVASFTSARLRKFHCAQTKLCGLGIWECGVILHLLRERIQRDLYFSGID